MLIMFHMASCEHMFKGLSKFLGGTPSWYVTAFPCLMAIGLVQVEM